MTSLLILLIVFALGLLVPLAVRPNLTVQRAGKIFAFCAIVLVPVAAGYAGLEEHMERTKEVAFCTSCHTMDRHGRSLHIDDVEHLPAAHYQYSRVPRDTACFACHTNYTLYGDLTAKLRGLRHVYVQYLGKVPDKIELYTPYNNRECLHCHNGSRSFVEAVTHKSEPGRFDAILANKKSCLSKDCHATIHDVDHVDTLAMWPPENKPAEKKDQKSEADVKPQAKEARK